MESDPLQPAPPDSAWVVIHSRPRCEKKVAEFCAQQRAACYLPLRRRVHRYGARVRTFLAPLFPGYVFCSVTRPQQTMLRQNRYVANFLPVVDPDQLLAQLRQIRTALAAGDNVEVLPYLEVGKRVRVTQGALKGLEGMITRVKGKTRIVLNVDMIRESVAVEVDGNFLDPA